MKYKLLLLITCIGTSILKADATQIYAQAIACAEDIYHCKKLKKMLLGMHFFRRVPILTTLGATDLKDSTPDEKVHDFVKKYIGDKNLTSQECSFHKAFEQKPDGQKHPECIEVWNHWVEIVCGTTEYCEKVRAAFSKIESNKLPPSNK